MAADEFENFPSSLHDRGGKDMLEHLDAHRSADLAFSLLCLLCLVRAVLLLLTPAATRYARARLHAPTDLLLVLVALSLLVPRLHRFQGE